MSKTKILIAVDDFPWAKIILYSAYNFIDKQNSEVTLLNVKETNVTEESLFYINPEKFIEHEAEKADFAILENFLENSDIDYKGFIYKEGNVSEIIINLVKTGGYDLVIIGSHNKTPLERLMLGSVAHKVVRHAKSSILIINKKNNVEIDEINPFSLLMGVDTSDNDFYVAENLYKFVDQARANVTLINATLSPSLIIPPDAYIYLDINKLIEETDSISENLLNLISDKLATTGINVVKKYHIEGDAASVIIDEAKKIKYDLITIGSHKGGDISRWLIGSVTAKVYEHAHQPVLIIKKPSCYNDLK